MMPLETLLAELLDVPEAELVDDAGRADLAAWTSLVHVQVVNAVEETYEVALTTGEISDATTVGRLRAILRRKGVPL